jgi:hypothetical protein
MYKRCAICGKPSKHDLCYGCYRQWGNKAPWIKALIKLERRNRYTNFNRLEVVFIDLNIEIE